MTVKCNYAVLCYQEWFVVVRLCRASNSTIEDTVLLVQSHTVAFDMYVVSIAHGVLYVRQSINSSGEREDMQ